LAHQSPQEQLHQRRPQSQPARTHFHHRVLMSRIRMKSSESRGAKVVTTSDAASAGRPVRAASRSP
jgi:hypothetical protein